MSDLTVLSIEEAALLPVSFCREHFPKRLERSARFLRNDDKLRCIAAGALTSHVLNVNEEALHETSFHKPFCNEINKHFNLSHSGKYVVLATDDYPVGVDIEQINPSHIDVAGEVFQNDELSWMQEDKVNRFFVLWTLKESVMKQCGLGFHLAPKSFSVLPLIKGESVSVSDKALYAKTLEYDGHIISVCTESPLKNVPIKVLSAKDISV